MNEKQRLWTLGLLWKHSRFNDYERHHELLSQNQKPNHNLRLSVIDDPAQELTLVAGVKFIPANHGKARSDGDHLDVHHCYFTYNTITLFIDWHGLTALTKQDGQFILWETKLWISWVGTSSTVWYSRV